MRALSFPHDVAAAELERQAEAFVAAAGRLDDLALLGASRCHGWSLLDVAVHVRTGLQEMALDTLARRTTGPTHDAASYWTTRHDDRGDQAVGHILWLRRTSSAYGRPTAAITHLRDATAAAIAAVRALPECVIAFQSTALTSGDYLATWVVELAVHQLDLGTDDEPPGLPWARATLEAIAGADLPPHLDDRTAVLAGLGRVPSEPGVLDSRFPVSL